MTAANPPKHGRSAAHLPGKPGYVDECPACLHEKTHPAASKKELPTPTAAAETLFRSMAEHMKSMSDVERIGGKFKRILTHNLNVPDDLAEEYAAQLKALATKHLLTRATQH